MKVDIEFVPMGEEGYGRGIEILNVLRFEVTLRRKRMYFRVICDGGVSRTYDYSEIKRITIESQDGSKGWDLMRREDVQDA